MSKRHNFKMFNKKVEGLLEDLDFWGICYAILSCSFVVSVFLFAFFACLNVKVIAMTSIMNMIAFTIDHLSTHTILRVQSSVSKNSTMPAMPRIIVSSSHKSLLCRCCCFFCFCLRGNKI